MTRLATSKELLELDWHYPVAHTFRETQRTGKGTSAVFVEQALPRATAFLKVNGEGNRKPLLVLRECVKCKGTEHALFDRRLDNEKTKLLCQWFYCVKLPPEVLDAKHPFRNLFAKEKPPHLFACKWDGTEITEFSGEQTQSELHKTLVRLIQGAYQKDPAPALKSMLRYLSEFDKFDGLLLTYEQKLQAEMLLPKPRAASLAKLKTQIERTKARRAEAMKRAKAVCDLKLKIDPPAAEKVPAASGGKAEPAR
ncbi:MAG: hypothetical protein KDC87_09450 [Planctomycetes bacterium]|nr:hypothetical protein [Planctomycetota bacterium]MCB9869543.1 hypothetical protein [Planctomycetota bacterium]MCB9889930.1 hypothetical protein [Planctomycetota bacterium]